MPAANSWSGKTLVPNNVKLINCYRRLFVEKSAFILPDNVEFRDAAQ